MSRTAEIPREIKTVYGIQKPPLRFFFEYNRKSRGETNVRLRNFQIKEVIIWKSRSTGNPGIYGGHVFWPVTPPVYLCGSGLWRSCGPLFFAPPPYGDGNRQLGLHVWERAPFAAIGFIKYHGMTAEKFLWVWIKSEISCRSIWYSIRRTYI